MKDDEKADYSIPIYGETAFKAEFSKWEIEHLRAEGINPRLLNAMDRAAIIHALSAQSDLVLNQRSTDVAALLYKFGALEEMLENNSDDEDSDDEKKEKQVEKARKEHEIIAHIEEMQRLQEMKPGQYAEENPIPPAFFDSLSGRPIQPVLENWQIGELERVIEIITTLPPPELYASAQDIQNSVIDEAVPPAVRERIQLDQDRKSPHADQTPAPERRAEHRDLTALPSKTR